MSTVVKTYFQAAQRLEKNSTRPRGRGELLKLLRYSSRPMPAAASNPPIWTGVIEEGGPSIGLSRRTDGRPGHRHGGGGLGAARTSGSDDWGTRPRLGPDNIRSEHPTLWHWRAQPTSRPDDSALFSLYCGARRPGSTTPTPGPGGSPAQRPWIRRIRPLLQVTATAGCCTG